MNAHLKTRSLHQYRSGLSLMELAIVVLLLSIIAAVIIPRFEPSVTGQLLASAEIITADMNFVRSLAVSNNSTYRVTFDRESNQYTIEHTGANPALDTLPLTTTFERTSDGKKYIVWMDQSPAFGVKAHVLGVESGSPPSVTDALNYDALGAPTPVGDCNIWLISGRGAGRIYLPIKVYAATGLVAIGEITATVPAAVRSAADEVDEVE
ncbi:MAG: hypothetical protein MPJ50_15265 [Pirellulales bacterium]|nr:hypothetical protein [Pirellulales bacterium]